MLEEQLFLSQIFSLFQITSHMFHYVMQRPLQTMVKRKYLLWLWQQTASQVGLFALKLVSSNVIWYLLISFLFDVQYMFYKISLWHILSVMQVEPYWFGKLEMKCRSILLFLLFIDLKRGLFRSKILAIPNNIIVLLTTTA